MSERPADSGVTKITVNKVEVEWTESSRREARLCEGGCGELTTGRVQGIGGRSQVRCMACAFREAFEKGRKR